MQDEVELREVRPSDIPVFFEHHLEGMAEGPARGAADRLAQRDRFEARWHGQLTDRAMTIRAILAGGRVAGYVAGFTQLGEPAIAYWLGRDFHGRGIATAALLAFLERIPGRPVFARVAADNLASLRVLAKCGFEECARAVHLSERRGCEVEEIVLVRHS